MSIKCLTPFVGQFTDAFFQLFQDKLAENVTTGEKIRLQKKAYVAEYESEKFTITIERGDKLNNS